MINKTGSFDISKKDEEGGIISPELADLFIEDSLSLIYPPRTIKRILYRPFLGKLYPYIDIKTPNILTQLSFFYGRLNMRISRERKCCVCEKVLNKSDEEIIWEAKVPLYVCQECRGDIFYDYWDCLRSTLLEASGRMINFGKAESSKVCPNFLEPQCGFPMESTHLNPCLENYGIGLLIRDAGTLALYAAPLTKLKYIMLWDGGIAGVILGYKRIIIQLDKLEELVKIIGRISQNTIRTLNKTLESEHCPIKISLPQTGKTEGSHKFSHKNNALNEWILYNFLDYYQFYEAQKYCKIFLQRPLLILRELLEHILREVRIEILEFLKFYKWYPPLAFNFREWLKENFKKTLDLKYMRDFTCERMERLRDGAIYSKENSVENALNSRNIYNNYLASKSNLKNGYVKDINHDIQNNENITTPQNENSLQSIQAPYMNFLEQFCPISQIKFNELTEELEIYEILGSFGKNLIINSNIHPHPCQINLNDLSGRSIY